MRISTHQLHQNGLNALLDQQSQLSKTQLQISTGRRVINPSDDPVAIASIFNLNQEIALTESYINNGEKADALVTQEEGTLNGINNILQRSRELFLQSGSAVLDDSQKQAIAAELENRLEELLGLANTRNANGDYIFSGFQSSVQAFTQDAAGNFIYNGDQGVRYMPVSTSVNIAISDSGYELFQNIPNGNGDFVAAGNVGNTGDGVIKPGSVTDRAAYVQDTYSITFVTNAAGNLAYNVFGATSGQLIPPLPANSVTAAPDYVEGTDIAFNGITVNIDAQPDVGDVFSITPSSSQDMFTTIQQAISALQTQVSSTADRAQYEMTINNALESLDNAMNNVDVVRARVGARLNSIESQIEMNASFILTAQTTLSGLQDLDMAEAITQLNFQNLTLEAAQASFARIQGLSLFNFL